MTLKLRVVGIRVTDFPTSFPRKDLLGFEHKAWRPILPLDCLLVNPQHSLTKKIFQCGLGTGSGPVEVGHQHRHAHVTQDLDGL